MQPSGQSRTKLKMEKMMAHIVLYTADDTQSPSSQWRVVSDQVMGGKSHVQMNETNEGVQLSGQVSLENNGGFVQLQFPLKTTLTKNVQPNDFEGIYLDWRSRKEQSMALLLKTSQLWLPWQSYRQHATVKEQWERVYLPFSAFSPYRTQTPLKLKHLTKFSILAGGEATDVCLTVSEMGFYR
jgi:hypothetical protein